MVSLFMFETSNKEIRYFWKPLTQLLCSDLKLSRLVLFNPATLFEHMALEHCSIRLVPQDPNSGL